MTRDGTLTANDALVLINFLNSQSPAASGGEGEGIVEATAPPPATEQAMFVMAAPADASAIAGRSASPSSEPLVDAVFRADPAGAGQEPYGNCDDAGWDGILSDLATAQRKEPKEDGADDLFGWLDGGHWYRKHSVIRHRLTGERMSVQVSDMKPASKPNTSKSKFGRRPVHSPCAT